MSFITIADAAVLTGKSIQTIRRMIKAKKVKIKKERTPQGFNYLIERDSAIRLVKSTHIADYTTTTQTDIQPVLGSQTTIRQHRQLFDEQFLQNEVERFNTTIQKMLEQHERDKQNFFALIKTFQDRVIMLESEVKQLQAPKKSWWRLF